MARTGRPPLPEGTKSLVRELIALGVEQTEIAERLAISRRSVQFIAARLLAADLKPGERRVDPPQRCPGGHLCSILPCRMCAAMPNRKLLDKLPAAEAKAAALGIPLNPPRRPRKKRPYELASQISPEQMRRLETIRQGKRERGETIG